MPEMMRAVLFVEQVGFVEQAGVIENPGRSVEGYTERQRIIAGTICPGGYINACLDGVYARDDTLKIATTP